MVDYDLIFVSYDETTVVVVTDSDGWTHAASITRYYKDKDNPALAKKLALKKLFEQWEYTAGERASIWQLFFEHHPEAKHAKTQPIEPESSTEDRVVELWRQIVESGRALKKVSPFQAYHSLSPTARKVFLGY